MFARGLLAAVTLAVTFVVAAPVFAASEAPNPITLYPQDKTALWGAYGYTPDKDVARIPMKVDTLPFAVEELTWSFVDMTNDGGRLALMWGKTMGSAPFTAR